MKKARILALAALVSVAVAASANAFPGSVWASVGSGPGGGPGSQLQLVCDTSTLPPGTPGRCDWVITVWYQTDGYGGGGWMLDLWSDPNSMDKLVAKDPLVFIETASNDPNDPNNNTANGLNTGGGHLVDSVGSSTTSPTVAGTYQLFQFTLSKLKHAGDTNDAAVFFGIGYAEFGGNDGGGYEVVSIGPNPPRPGFSTGDVEPIPLILIDNTPEPATVSLIGLGLVALLRRRR